MKYPWKKLQSCDDAISWDSKSVYFYIYEIIDYQSPDSYVKCLMNQLVNPIETSPSKITPTAPKKRELCYEEARALMESMSRERFVVKSKTFLDPNNPMEYFSSQQIQSNCTDSWKILVTKIPKPRRQNSSPPIDCTIQTFTKKTGSVKYVNPRCRISQSLSTRFVKTKLPAGSPKLISKPPPKRNRRKRIKKFVSDEPKNITIFSQTSQTQVICISPANPSRHKQISDSESPSELPTKSKPEPPTKKSSKDSQKSNRGRSRSPDLKKSSKRKSKSRSRSRSNERKTKRSRTNGEDETPPSKKSRRSRSRSPGRDRDHHSKKSKKSRRKYAYDAFAVLEYLSKQQAKLREQEANTNSDSTSKKSNSPSKKSHRKHSRSDKKHKSHRSSKHHKRHHSGSAELPEDDQETVKSEKSDEQRSKRAVKAPSRLDLYYVE